MLAAGAKLRPLWRDFDTVRIQLEAMAFDSDSRSVRLDALLLRNLAHLRYIRTFDHVFQSGARSVRVERPVWLDRCEVRQGDFYKFAQWQPFNPGRVPSAPAQPDDWQYRSDSKDHAVSGRLDAPASGITWFDAWGYCAAAGGRLPTIEEWIASARGADGRLFAWGDTFDESSADAWPYLDPLLNATQRCGAHPATDTPNGIADLGGGVSEWTQSGDGHVAPVAGGNAYNVPRELYSLAALYRNVPTHHRSAYLGFRCAYDTPPAATPWRTPAAAVALAPGVYPIGLPPDARLPSLVANLPSDRLHIVERIFERGSASAEELHFTQREITRREYAAFLADPFVKAGFYAEANQPRGHSHRPPDWEAQLASPELPVVNVDWWSAYAFAAWAGGRLPTAEEWERAASGRGERVYPWGNDFDAAAPATGERALRGPAVSDGGDGDATPDGLLAMGGNVSEWTRSVSTASGGLGMVAKGGNYLLPGRRTARLDFSNHLSPHYRSPTLGFRVVFERPR